MEAGTETALGDDGIGAEPGGGKRPRGAERSLAIEHRRFERPHAAVVSEIGGPRGDEADGPHPWRRLVALRVQEHAGIAAFGQRLGEGTEPAGQETMNQENLHVVSATTTRDRKSTLPCLTGD